MERTVTIEDGRYAERVRRGVELMAIWAAEDALVPVPEPAERAAA